MNKKSWYYNSLDEYVKNDIDTTIRCRIIARFNLIGKESFTTEEISKMEEAYDIAIRVRKYRKYNFITQEELAKILKTNRTYISNVELGSKALTGSYYIKFIQLERLSNKNIITYAINVTLRYIKSKLLFWKKDI